MLQGGLKMVLDWLGQSIQLGISEFMARFGWGGVAVLVAGTLLLLSSSVRAAKFCHSPKGMAVSAAVLAAGLFAVWWGWPIAQATAAIADASHVVAAEPAVEQVAVAAVEPTPEPEPEAEPEPVAEVTEPVQPEPEPVVMPAMPVIVASPPPALPALPIVTTPRLPNRRPSASAGRLHPGKGHKNSLQPTVTVGPPQGGRGRATGSNRGGLVNAYPPQLTPRQQRQAEIDNYWRRMEAEMNRGMHPVFGGSGMGGFTGGGVGHGHMSHGGRR